MFDYIIPLTSILICAVLITLHNCLHSSARLREHLLPLIISVIFPYAVSGLHVSLQEFLSYLRFLPVGRVL